jgi:hypothetical protein
MAAIAGGVGLLLLCISSSVAATMRGKDDDTPTPTPTPKTSADASADASAGPSAGPSADASADASADPPPPPPTYVEGDRVRFTHNIPIMLAEVLIYDSEDKLISHKGMPSVTHSPTHPGWGGAERLTDWQFMIPFHSVNDTKDAYVEFKFDRIKKIKRIQVLARTDARTSEVGGLSILVVNREKIVAKKNIPSWNNGSSHLVEYDPGSDAFISSNSEGPPIKATKVRLLNFGSDNLIISEMQVFDKDGNNVALEGNAVLSTTHHPDWAAKHANDDNFTNTAHSKDGAGAGQYLDINLPNETEISKVVVFNRVGNISTRGQIHKSVVEFYNDTEKVLVTPPIPNGDRAEFEYKVGKYLNRWTMT